MFTGAIGHTPKIIIQERTVEQAKYEKAWASKKYREISPGEHAAQIFISKVVPEKGADCIDFGCGTGRGSMALAVFGGLKMHMLDFAHNCLDDDVLAACKTQPNYFRFTQHDLTRPVPARAKYGYCTDVLEHIPEDDVPTVLKNILDAAQYVFMTIATKPDYLGKELVGGPLHLTVRPMAWWEQQLKSLGATVYWAIDDGGDTGCAIYASTWQVMSVNMLGRINTDAEIIDNQIEENIKAGWQHARPYPKQDREVVLLCGGPSINNFVDDIRKHREEGAAIITMNGSYNWALEKNIKVSAQIVLDAREFNSRFTKPVIEDCKYLIASQAHPKTLDGLPKDRTFLWHVGLDKEQEQLAIKQVGYVYPVPGGSTVTLRAIPLLRMLGFSQFHMYGFDSCVQSVNNHHGYSQPENDTDLLINVTCGNRVFMCTGWQLAQAREFRDVVKLIGDEVELAVYGDGLIAAIMCEGAELSTEEE